MRLNKSLLTSLSFAASLVSATTVTHAEDKRVTVSAPWEISSVDPSISGFALQRMQVMETLVDVAEDGRLQPGLATGWNASEDGLSWRFILREDVAFHDGSKLDAGVAVAVLKRAAEQPGILKKAPIAGIEADGEAVVITLDAPFAALPSLLAHSTTIIPAPTSFDADGKSVEAIGTGPYKVEKLSIPQGFDVARFDDYWGDTASISAAQYLSSSRAETRALLAESGDADLVFTLDPSGYARLKQVDGVDVRAVPIPRVVTLKVNAGHPFFAEPEARHALSLAVDREGIAAGITRFSEAAATQLFPPALGAWHDDALDPLGYDPEKAKDLLAGLGWKPGDDGVLARDGERFSILLRTFPDRPELPLIATALQDQWAQIGIELEVSVSNYSEIPAGHQDGSLHVALYARNYGQTPDPIGTVLADFGAGGGDWGAMNWKAPAVADALVEIAADANDVVRAPLIAEVTKAIHADLPLIPIVWYQHTIAVAKGLEGVRIDPLERTYGLSTAKWAD